MPDGVVSNLGLTAGAGFYANVGIHANTNYANTITSYRSNDVISPLLYTISRAATDPGLAVSPATLTALKTIGADINGNYCPALGDTVPSNVSLTLGNVGLSGMIAADGNVYVGSGNFRVFAQAFQTALGFASVTNQVILSVCNSTDYLGPTFTNMDDLISGDISKVNLAFTPFGEDLVDTGDLIQFEDIGLLGTPAGLLSSIAAAGNMINGTTPAVRTVLLDAGLTDQDISDLVNNNVESLLNPDGLTENQFDVLQKRAYPALCEITGADLQDVLDILGITLDNITALCQLLDPKKIFPRSYPSLTLEGVLVYGPDDAVNPAIEELLPQLVPKGCDDLAKIIPPDQAAANRALQIAFGQINSITQLTGRQLGRLLT